MKRHGLFFHSHDVDSRRLTEAFFSQAPGKKSSSKKPLIIFLLSCIILLAGVLYVRARYEFVFIPKTNPIDSESGLIANRRLASLSLINTADNPAKITSSGIWLVVPRGKKIGLVFDLAKPCNLHNKNIILAIQNTTAPLLADVFVKDINFHSTSLHPVQFKIETTKSESLIKILISFEPSKIQTVNFSQIKQIKLLLRYDNKLTQPKNIPLRAWEKRMVFIKDVLLVGKEGI